MTIARGITGKARLARAFPVIPFRNANATEDAKLFFIEAIQNSGCIAAAMGLLLWRSIGEKGQVDRGYLYCEMAL